MIIKFLSDFYFLLNEIVDFIAKDKPFASRKFKKDLLIALKKDLQNPYSFKKSIYFDDSSTRDYVFKSYTITYKIETENKLVVVLGIIKNKNTF